jgi:hypothetical protein
MCWLLDGSSGCYLSPFDQLLLSDKTFPKLLLFKFMKPVFSFRRNSNCCCYLRLHNFETFWLVVSLLKTLSSKIWNQNLEKYICIFVPSSRNTIFAVTLFCCVSLIWRYSQVWSSHSLQNYPVWSNAVSSLTASLSNAANVLVDLKGMLRNQ